MNLEKKDPIIYLICGKARNGKSTVSKFIKEELESRGKKCAQMLIAKYIKDYAKDYFGWDGQESTKPRDLLITLGTDLIRLKLDRPKFLITRTCEDMEILSYFFDVFLVDDVRFVNEIETVREKFKNVVVIKVNRDNKDDGLTESQRKDLTEISLDNYNDYDYVIDNNGSLENLKEKAIELI